MANKKAIFILLLLSTIGVVLYFVTKKQWHKTVFSIEASVLDIHDYIKEPQKINQWYAAFVGEKNTLTDSTIEHHKQKIAIVGNSLLRTEWRVYNQTNDSSTYIFKIIPTEQGHNQLHLYSYQSYWNKWFNKQTRNNATHIAYLKKYLETPSLFYGIDVSQAKVVDTFFLVMNTTTTKPLLQQQTLHNYTTMLQIAEQKNLGYYGTKLIHESPAANDSIMLYTAIAINKYIDFTLPNNIQFSQMPKGNLLISQYNGKFGDRNEAIKRFVKYAAKNKYQTMALPFEKITDTSFDFNPEKSIPITLCYPTY